MDPKNGIGFLVPLLFFFFFLFLRNRDRRMSSKLVMCWIWQQRCGQERQSSVHLDMMAGPAWGVLLLLWSLAHVSCVFPYSVCFRSPILLFMCKSEWIPGSPYGFHHFCLPSDEHKFSLVQLFSCFQLFATPWTAAHQASLSITNTCRLLKLMSIKLMMPSNHLKLCCPLLLLPSIFSRIRVFCNESLLRIRWPKCWSFSFSISLSNEYSGLISFRMDWLDLLAVQETLKRLLKHHSSKA